MTGKGKVLIAHPRPEVISPGEFLETTLPVPCTMKRPAGTRPSLTAHLPKAEKMAIRSSQRLASFSHRQPAPVPTNNPARLESTPSLCERMTMTGGTEKVYLEQVTKFKEWMSSNSLPAFSGHEVLLAALDYLDYLFLEGEDSPIVNHLIAGLTKFVPAVRDHPTMMTRLADAAKGWRKRAPGLSRPAPPAAAVHAVTGVLLYKRQVLMALAAEVSFEGYLRPIDLCSLRVRELISPQPLAGASHKTWCLLLHSVDSISKTAERDESIILNGEVATKLQPIFKEMKKSRHMDAKLFPFDQSAFSAAILDAAKTLGLHQRIGFVAYSLRHAGASHDMLTQCRSLSEIKMRGRWKCDASLLRYAKASYAQATAAAIDPKVLVYGNLIFANLTAYMSGAMQVPPTPAIQSAVSWNDNLSTLFASVAYGATTKFFWHMGRWHIHYVSLVSA